MLFEPFEGQGAEPGLVSIPQSNHVLLEFRLEAPQALPGTVTPERRSEALEIPLNRAGEEALVPRETRSLETAGYALGSQRFEGHGELGLLHSGNCRHDVLASSSYEDTLAIEALTEGQRIFGDVKVLLRRPAAQARTAAAGYLAVNRGNGARRDGAWLPRGD
jgi:hypothetical protein